MIVCDLCPPDDRKPAAMRMTIETFVDAFMSEEVRESVAKLGISPELVTSVVGGDLENPPAYTVEMCVDHMAEANGYAADAFAERVKSAVHR